MGGGFIQLVAYGAQDIYLTGNPQITFFKFVYRRHTNFASENFNQFPVGQIKWGNKLVFTIDRKGDLLGNCFIDFYLEFKNSSTTLTLDQIKSEYFLKESSLAKSLGFSFIDYIEIDIGGQIIDRHSGHWLAIKSEIEQQFNKRIKEVFLNGPFNESYHLGDNIIHISIPLQFWFNKDPGLHLPLVSLQYHDVKIIVKLNSLNKFVLNSTNSSPYKVTDIIIKDLNLNCDYIYLDTEERKKFAQVCHEYLIEQVQEQPGEFCKNGISELIIPLNLNHPVKELIWTIIDPSLTIKYGPYWSNGSEKVKTCLIQMNGVDRFSEKPANYFRNIQKYQYHKGIDLRKFIKDMVQPFIPILSGTSDLDIPVVQLDTFNYSFALKPSDIQPSGTCNFSRLDNSILKITFKNDISSVGNFNVKIFAVNYNVLRIKAGMGGLAYSN